MPIGSGLSPGADRPTFSTAGRSPRPTRPSNLMRPMASISPIQVPGTARPGGHYSQAIVHNGLVYVAGQLPVDLATGKAQLGTVEEQTRRVLENMEQILRTAGSSLQHVVQVTAYITKLDDWDAINATYAEIMGSHRPARAIVPVPELHYGVALEVTCIAAVAQAES